MAPRDDSRYLLLESRVQSIETHGERLRADSDAIKATLSSLNGSITVIKWLAGLMIPALLFWVAWVTVTIARSGSSTVISELRAPKSPEKLQASLNTVLAQIQTAQAEGKKPDKKKVTALSGALSVVASKNPNLPETWRAVAALVSYRSSDIKIAPLSLPDCDVSISPMPIDPKDIPEVPEQTRATAKKGYIFRNCRLHLDHLPAGKLYRFPRDDPKTGNRIQPEEVLIIGWVAVVINCEIVMNNSGVAESPIMQFDVVNSRLTYQIEDAPNERAQRMLLASLNKTDAPAFIAKLDVPQIQ